MAAKRRRYDNMDDILDKQLDSDRSDLDDDIGLGDESDIDSDWEHEYEDERVFCRGGVGDADHGGVVGDADVVGADVDGGVGHADCGAGSSVVRDGSIEDSVRRDSGDECGGLVGGGDYDQSDNNDVDSGGDGYCLRGDDGGLNCLRGGVRLRSGVRGRGGVRVCDGRFCVVGGRGKRGVCVSGGVHGPKRGLGVLTMELQIFNGSLLALLMRSYLMTPSLSMRLKV